MKKIIALLLLFSSLFAYALKPTNIAGKKLSDLTNKEVAAMFLKVNRQFKTAELDKTADKMGNTLNGSLLFSVSDTLLVRKTFGYLKLYEKRTHYENMSYSYLLREKRNPDNLLTDSSCFELASISKQFTAAALLKLVSENKLSLSDYLTKFFPQLPYRGITIKHLLTHTSGLPEYIDFPDSYFNTEQWLTNSELINILARRKERIQFLPGAQFKYTNTNYILLAAIVEQLSGMRFEDYVKENLFMPAGMRNTFYVTDLLRQQRKDVPNGHAKSAEVEIYKYSDGTIGDKGIYSNPDDLLRWIKAYFIDYSVLAKEWVDQATTTQNKLNSGIIPSERYGFGLRLEENKNYGFLVFHGGLWHGFQNVMIYRPSDHFIMICLSNYRNGAHRGKSNEVLHIWDGV